VSVMSITHVVYKGDCKCSRCGVRPAYYRLGSVLYCGRCCNKRKFPARETLPEDPERAKKLALADTVHINTARMNAGKIIPKEELVKCTTLYMRQHPKAAPYRVPVLPNRMRHSRHSFGIHIPSLSPMNIGPVHHGQPGLPPASCLENLHQGNKVWPDEIDPQTGNPGKTFFKTQKDIYTCETPMRHKRDRSAGRPRYSVWILGDGTLKRHPWVESRYHYCRIYAESIFNSSEFRGLVDMVRAGIPIEIFGFDARLVDCSSAASWYETYVDPERPFGHELVLACMLCAELNPEIVYPWEVYRAHNPDLYGTWSSVPDTDDSTDGTEPDPGDPGVDPGDPGVDPDEQMNVTVG
jgi:hypothetical protein